MPSFNNSVGFVLVLYTIVLMSFSPLTAKVETFGLPKKQINVCNSTHLSSNNSRIIGYSITDHNEST